MALLGYASWPPPPGALGTLWPASVPLGTGFTLVDAGTGLVATVAADVTGVLAIIDEAGTTLASGTSASVSIGAREGNAVRIAARFTPSSGSRQIQLALNGTEPLDEQLLTVAQADALYVAKASQEFDIGTTNLLAPGGVAIGGQGPGVDKTFLSSSGNSAWTQFVPSRVGSASQNQVYPGGFAGLGTATSGTNQITLTTGTLAGYFSDLYVGMPIGFAGQLYLLDAVPTSGTLIAVRNPDGTAVSFASTFNGTYKLAYTVSEGVCTTNGTAVTWVSGDYFTLGNYYTNKILINGTWTDVAAVASQTSLTASGSVGTNTAVAFKQVCVDSAIYFTMLRLQGLRGGNEDYLFMLTNVLNQGRVETNALGAGVQALPLVLGTGADAAIPAAVNFNTRKAHLEITPTGEVRVGSYFADPFTKPSAQLDPTLYTLTADLPKFAAYRYSATALVAGGTTRIMLGRFGTSYAGTKNALDIASYNNTLAPSIQGRNNAGGVLDFALQPEGGQVGVSVNTPFVTLDVGGKGWFGTGTRSQPVSGNRATLNLSNAAGADTDVYFLTPGTAGCRFGLDSTNSYAMTMVLDAPSFLIKTGGSNWDSLNTGTLAFKVAGGSVIVGPGSALATTATSGFIYVPTSAGAPTGVPAANTGAVALQYDTTNNKLWIYNGGWKGVVLA